jgi:hypothetical protein
MKKIIFYMCCALSLVAYSATLIGLFNNDGAMCLLGLFEFIGFTFIGAITLSNIEKNTFSKEEQEWYGKQGYDTNNL